MAVTTPKTTHQSDDTFLTREEIAGILGVSPRSVERYTAQRLIPLPIRIGKQACLRWRKSTFMAFLAKQDEIAQRTS